MYDRVYNRLSTDDCVDSNSRNCLICTDELVVRINPSAPSIFRDTRDAGVAVMTEFITVSVLKIASKAAVEIACSARTNLC